MTPVATANSTIVQAFAPIRRTRGAQPSVLMSENSSDPETVEKWNEFIKSRLLAWEWQADEMAEDDFIPPTRKAIETALRNARIWRDGGLPCPVDMIPNRDGGIVFLRCEKSGDEETTIEFLEDGTCFLLQFLRNRLIERIVLGS